MTKMSDDLKKRIAIGVFVVFAAVLIYTQIFGGSSAPPPPPPVVVTNAGSARVAPQAAAVNVPPGFATTAGAQKVGTSSGQLDPTLHMEAMRLTETLVYAGTGRNIFAAPGSAPLVAVVPKANFPARTAAPVQQVMASAPVNLGPPPPPPINLKFFGTATTPNGTRRAFLLNGDDVYLASAGDVVQRRYRVISIAATSIQVEDMPNSNKQTLPLVGN